MKYKQPGCNVKQKQSISFIDEGIAKIIKSFFYKDW